MPVAPELKSLLEALRSEDEARPLPEDRPKAVIDTNVLMDFWRFGDPDAAPLLELLEAGKFAALRDAETENEFAEVIHRPQFGLTLEEQTEILTHWHRISWLVPKVEKSPNWVKDPLDQKLLDLASSGRAQFLVSKDKLVLKAGRRAKREGMRILKPEDAAEAIAQGVSSESAG